MKVKSIVAGIDFGTSCSGYAYAYTKDTKDEPEEIYAHDKWEGGGGLNMKTLTQIVLDKDRKYVAFGYEARDYFNNTDEEENSLLNSHFAFYKMRLFNKQNRAQPVNDVKSLQSATPQELISETLKYFKNCVMTKINDESATMVFESDIQWVITIPAIWDDSCKQIMRSCAEEAGLCSKNDKESLILAFEPEAGALQCIYEKTSGYSVDVGKKFMIIDNGGGTSDMVAYEQMEGKSLHSISRPFGGDFGSTYVNANFIKFLEDLFGKDEMKIVFGSSRYQSLMDAFESHKKSFKTSNSNPTSTKFFDLDPMSLFGKDVPWLMDKINTYNESTSSIFQNPVKYSDNRRKLILPFELFLSFFTPLFKSITDCIKSEMESNPGISKLDFIFLIGGFNENTFLQEHIKRELEFTGAKFIIPKHPTLSVVMGAVRFGLHPDAVSKRYQSKCYATEIQEEVKPDGKHVGKPLIKRGGTSYCPNVCDVFVKVGQMIGFDETITRSYMPTSVGQKIIEVSIFSSHRPTISYTTDPGIQFIGELCLVIPNPELPVTDNRIDVSIKFRSTENIVTATHFKSGHEISIKFDMAIDEAESIRRNKSHQDKNKPPKVQLCIMLDCTWSMSRWIAESKSKVIQLMDSLCDSYSGLELLVSFVGYRDHCDSDRFEIVHFTSDMELLQLKIGKTEATGGGDVPEDIAGAFKQVESLSWESDYTKLIVHIADAPCHGSKYHSCDDSYPNGDPSGLIPEEILNTLNGKGVDYYFIKINNITDKMIEVFRSKYDTPQKKIVVQDLGDDVSKLLPSLINFVTNSITRYSK